MRISDWSSDVCSSDLGGGVPAADARALRSVPWRDDAGDAGRYGCDARLQLRAGAGACEGSGGTALARIHPEPARRTPDVADRCGAHLPLGHCCASSAKGRSEEHTSELQSLMRISYAVFCLKKKTKKIDTDTNQAT